MDNLIDKLSDKVQDLRETISKGGWKKWVAYLGLAALLAIGLSVTLLKGYFIRKKLANALTKADILEEELIQREAEDKIDDLEEQVLRDIVSLEEVAKKIAELDKFEADAAEEAANNDKVIAGLKSWDDVAEKVDFNEEDSK